MYDHATDSDMYDYDLDELPDHEEGRTHKPTLEPKNCPRRSDYIHFLRYEEPLMGQ